MSTCWCRPTMQNPVRARIVLCPQEYKWSSYAGNALGKHDPLLTPHALYLNLGKNPLERQQSYRHLFWRGVPFQLVEALREATNKGWAFGSEAFKSNLRVSANRAPESSGWGAIQSWTKDSDPLLLGTVMALAPRHNSNHTIDQPNRKIPSLE